MKHLILKTQHYQQLEREFKEWLQVLGYHPLMQIQQLSNVREFLYKLEEQGLCNIEQITTGAIQQHYDYLLRRTNVRRGGGLSNSSVSKHISAIRLLFRYCEEAQRISNNPISAINFKSYNSPPVEFFTQQEIRQLYSAGEKYRDRALLSVFYGCGLRKSEAEKLTVKDIDYSGKLLYVREGKGKKRRVIPMSSSVRDDLENYLFYERTAINNQETFFINKKNTAMRGQSFPVWFKDLKEKAGIIKPEGLHSLRHSIATHLLENGVKVEYVRDFLGHEFLETTQIYTRVNKEQLVEISGSSSSSSGSSSSEENL